MSVSVDEPASRSPAAAPDPLEPPPDPLEALIEEARQRTRRRRRGYALSILVAGLMAAGIALVILLGTGGRAQRPGANRAAGLPSLPGAGGDRYWYTRTIQTLRLERPAGGEYQAKVFMRARGPMVAFEVRLSTETWVGVDGTTRTRTLVLSQRFASASGSREWAAYHRPLPDFARDLSSDSIVQGAGRLPVSGPAGDPLGPQDIGDGAFSPRQLQALPTQPLLLLHQINRAFSSLGRREAASALNPCGWGAVTGCAPQAAVPGWQRRATQASVDLQEIAEMLGWPVSQHLRRALLDAAARLPAISRAVSVRRTTGGRAAPATTVSISPRPYPGRFTPVPQRLVFVRSSGAVLEEPSGVVTVQGPASSVWSLPAGATAPRATMRPPIPPAVEVRPRVGGPHTVFEVSVPSPQGAERFGGGVSGPVYPGCRSGFRSPTPPTPAPWLTARRVHGSGARTVYTYRLKPPAGTGHVWCPGLYQVALVRSGLGAASASDLGSAVALFRVS